LTETQKLFLAERVLAAFDEFLEGDLWKQSYENFQKNGFKVHLTKEIAGKQLKIPFDMGKFLKPQLVDRAILEIKDLIYSYAQRNPEKATEFIRQIVAKLNSILDSQTTREKVG